MYHFHLCHLFSSCFPTVTVMISNWSLGATSRSRRSGRNLRTRTACHTIILLVGFLHTIAENWENLKKTAAFLSKISVRIETDLLLIRFYDLIIYLRLIYNSFPPTDGSFLLSKYHFERTIRALPSGHTTLKWRRINVDATWSRRIDVDTTSFWCLPAGWLVRIIRSRDLLIHSNEILLHSPRLLLPKKGMTDVSERNEAIFPMGSLSAHMSHIWTRNRCVTHAYNWCVIWRI